MPFSSSFLSPLPSSCSPFFISQFSSSFFSNLHAHSITPPCSPIGSPFQYTYMLSFPQFTGQNTFYTVPDFTPNEVLTNYLYLHIISLLHDIRYKNGAGHPQSIPRGKLRPRKLLSVTVSVAGNAFSQGPEVYR